ncbi:cupin domain-containing protein [Nesterenkonia lutea]|uniref:Ethanolamine utilization protein EutQ (Cupin superfamily) n=1 Tax=Nesterenkonia lutea TaxID=272919 RepID=A0ABR9JGS8_9MICC|nr:cupin domain-containing protein [Nesterenkonia lutea]MBE1525129.1 ethanolamine utilization protein EutQ (cupin superfamily) [Nesterenkonia lutea]
MEKQLLGTMTKTGSIHKVTGAKKDIPSMNVPGVEAFIGDALMNPEGARMCSGFFELKAGEPLEYEYTYDEMKYVVKGQFKLTDMKTGEQVLAEEGEILFFPKGTPVRFETDDYALGFFTGDRDFVA